MRICLVDPGGEVGRSVRRLAALLAGTHEVAVAAAGEPRAEAATLSFASPEHRRSAAVLDRIRAAYGDVGPDYLEVPDAGAAGLVPLQARLSGDPLLAGTLVGVRISPSSELCSLHDQVLSLPAPRRAAELEREQLRLADRLLWPGGDTLELYRRYYADLRLPPPLRIGPAIEPPPPTPTPPPPEPGRPLRILYAGELRRCLGALDLAEACLSLPTGEWELTMVGADTATATMGQSVALTIEAMAGADPRLRIEGEVGPAELRRRLPDFDLLAVPSRLDAWSEVAIEALAAGLPVLATPVGGLAEIVEHEVSGWQAEDIGAAALGRSLGRLLDDRDELERVRASGRPAERARELADPAPLLAAYEQLAAEVSGRAPDPARAPGEQLVTGVVPFHGVAEHVAEAVSSLLDQTHPAVEVLIVNDGSFAAADAVLTELALDPRVSVVTQPNRGEAAARNLGAQLARGEYLVMLDSDNLLEPRFVARALAAYRHQPDLAYVTCWLRMIDERGAEVPGAPGYAPLGNAVVSGDTENWDGDTLAMLPRRLFTELGFGYGPFGSIHSDWELYRWLRDEGRYGVVIPELLARYRVRPGSLLRMHGEQLQERGWEEARNRNLRRRTRWVAG